MFPCDSPNNLTGENQVVSSMSTSDIPQSHLKLTFPSLCMQLQKMPKELTKSRQVILELQHKERERERELLKQLNNGTYSKVSWPFLLKIKREIFLEVISYGKLQLFKEIFYCLKRNCSFIFKRIRYYDFINESNKRKMWKAIDECLIKCIKIEIQKHTGKLKSWQFWHIKFLLLIIFND